jgi:hypothetical protein
MSAHTATLSRRAALANITATAVQSEATRAAYRSDFALFRAWCARRGVSALPASPETVVGRSGTALPW